MFIENLKMAIAALISNKMRSFLTMLGIIIGIGSVISIISIGDSVKKMVLSIYENVGVTQSMIYPNIQDEAGERESDYFSSEDIEKFKQIFGDELEYIDTNSSITGDVKTRSGINKLTLNGVDYNFINTSKLINIKYGRFFTAADIEHRKYLAIVEDTAALKMFGKENVVGEIFREKFNGVLNEFKIIGVYSQNLSPLQKLLITRGQSLNAFIPSSLFIESENDTFFSLRIFANKTYSGEKLKTFNDKFLDYLAKYKGRTKEDYSFYSASSEMGAVGAFLNVVSLGMGGIAFISLIVGGIGIMNIMLVSVTERTREIGTRKALGATTADILTQFLIESAVISAIGGIIGILIAAGGISLIGFLLHQEVVIKPLAIILSVAFSALVGIFFGIYPAKKAANRDPIVALRYE